VQNDGELSKFQRIYPADHHMFEDRFVRKGTKQMHQNGYSRQYLSDEPLDIREEHLWIMIKNSTEQDKRKGKPPVIPDVSSQTKM
jgi:hypothetical protein